MRIIVYLLENAVQNEPFNYQPALKILLSTYYINMKKEFIICIMNNSYFSVCVSP